MYSDPQIDCGPVPNARLVGIYFSSCLGVYIPEVTLNHRVWRRDIFRRRKLDEHIGLGGAIDLLFLDVDGWFMIFEDVTKNTSQSQVALFPNLWSHAVVLFQTSPVFFLHETCADRTPAPHLLQMRHQGGLNVSRRGATAAIGARGSRVDFCKRRRHIIDVFLWVETMTPQSTIPVGEHPQ